MVQAPFGPVAIHVEAGRVQRLRLAPGDLAPREGDSALAEQVRRQLLRWLDDPGYLFDLPLADTATGFQRRVRAALMAIPPGETRTYGELAEGLNSVARAVGGACRNNPLPIVVPCHRVLARGGAGGFMGETDGPKLAIKHWLLRHEQEGRPHAGRLL